MAASERLRWAARVLQIQPGEQLLEIGSGNGAAALQVAPLLGNGRLLGIDASPRQVDLARRQWAAAGSPPQVEFMELNLRDIDREARGPFDKIFAFNVPCFQKEPGDELGIIRRLLKPAGRLYIFHQPPAETTRAVAERQAGYLRRHFYEVLQILYLELKRGSASCVICRPSAPTA
jgi:cyclopropane fatty-acyl-phospholipid synthase-like methyltransferase